MQGPEGHRLVTVRHTTPQATLYPLTPKHWISNFIQHDAEPTADIKISPTMRWASQRHRTLVTVVCPLSVGASAAGAVSEPWWLECESAPSVCK